jgi:outer membrane autotransporter protein
MKDYSLRLLPVFGSLLLLLAAGDVRAQAGTSPWYVTAIVGGVNQSSQTLDYRLGGASASAEASYSAGLLAGAALGYGFGNVWRVEAEFTYQSTDLKGNPFAGTAGPAGNGDHAATALALNLFREFDLFGSPKVRTYTGLGLVYLTENDIDFEVPGQPGRSFSGSGTGVQFLLGARYDLGEHWFVDAGVRYLLASTVEMDGEGGTPGRVDARFRPWGLTAAVGWRF